MSISTKIIAKHMYFCIYIYYYEQCDWQRCSRCTQNGSCPVFFGSHTGLWKTEQVWIDYAVMSEQFYSLVASEEEVLVQGLSNVFSQWTHFKGPKFSYKNTLIFICKQPCCQLLVSTVKATLINKTVCWNNASVV